MVTPLRRAWPWLAVAAGITAVITLAAIAGG